MSGDEKSTVETDAGVGPREYAWPDINPENAKLILQRVAVRLKAGRSPPIVRPAPKKGDFPKLVFLDQWAWIQLSRAHYGMKVDLAAHAALKALRDSKAGGTIVVPLTETNIVESAEHMSEERRKRLAEFMIELSGNQSFLNPIDVRGLEGEVAIDRHIRGQPVEINRSALVQWGIDPAVSRTEMLVPNGDPGISRLVAETMSEPEVSVAKMVHALGRPTVEKLRQRDKDGVVTIEGVRAVDRHLSPEERMPREMFNVLTRGSLADQIHAAVARLGVPAEVFVDWLRSPEKLLRLTGDMPGLHVQATLVLERDRNPNEKTDANDFKDVSFLNQAIPYGDIVVAERLWTHVAKSTGLPARYGTAVISSLAALPEALAKGGCL